VGGGAEGPWAVCAAVLSPLPLRVLVVVLLLPVFRGAWVACARAPMWCVCAGAWSAFVFTCPQVLSRLCRQLLEAGFPVVHFYTMNLAHVVNVVLRDLGLGYDSQVRVPELRGREEGGRLCSGSRCDAPLPSFPTPPLGGRGGRLFVMVFRPGAPFRNSHGQRNPPPSPMCTGEASRVRVARKGTEGGVGRVCCGLPATGGGLQARRQLPWRPSKCAGREKESVR
jgi:hypothetical protein